jgi:hypothetical protein
MNYTRKRPKTRWSCRNVYNTDFRNGVTLTRPLQSKEEKEFWKKYNCANYETKQKMKSNPIFIEWLESKKQ